MPRILALLVLSCLAIAQQRDFMKASFRRHQCKKRRYHSF